MNVSGLAEALNQEQSMVSHNLKLLERCNLVFTEKRGKEKYVSRNEDTVGVLIDVVESHAEKFCALHSNCIYSK